MTITTNTNIDPQGTGVWAVQGEIFGQAATVFTGSVFECLRFAKENA